MAEQADYNRRLIAEFRSERGKIGGPLAGRPLLLLTTTGAKSGQPRTTPLMYIPIDDQLLLIASNMGAATHPDWYRNIVAQPHVTIELGAETFEARATVAAGAERDRLWAMLIALYPFFTEHQAKTTREIPLIVLDRLAEAGDA